MPGVCQGRKRVLRRGGYSHNALRACTGQCGHLLGKTIILDKGFYCVCTGLTDLDQTRRTFYIVAPIQVELR
jgi:hypothetical protein